MSLKPVAEAKPFVNYVRPDVQGGKFSQWIPSAGDIAANVRKVAMPVITLYMLSQIPVVGAGPLEYMACIAGCTILTGPAAVTCFHWCAPVILLPGP
jgi:hypothetical protein